ncbi:adhesion G protein-coupled receptor F5-like isoform X2 [Genypterus blacodes]|uniref:adhesion G protein-coupled receptor F5-like isoform X2 n=1 Tax=Genypterus blacodes TaxID=154954 RepID=UPI003F75F825
MQDIRNRMWIFIFLYSLGLNICQASGEGTSTQMYYSIITIEESAIKNITEKLRSLILDKDNAIVGNVTMTTNCKVTSAQNRICTCLADHKWSDEACTSQQCCRSNIKQCSLPKDSAARCVPNSSVTVKGDVTLSVEYHDCLAGRNTKTYQDCHDKLLKELKTLFSAIRGFDRIRIMKFSLGSVIVKFELTFADSISRDDFNEKAKTMSEVLKSLQLSMETKGVVVMEITSGPVCGSSESITCKSQEDLKTEPKWHLTRAGKRFDITDGTESEVSSSPTQTSVRLRNISENWAGEFSCAYIQKFDFGTITHQARGTLDVVLSPHISITSEPAFPLCKDPKQLVKVKIQCEIKTGSDNYVVAWHGHANKSEIKQSHRLNTSLIYAADTIVGCDPDFSPTVNCTFTNRCNQSRAETLLINIIHKSQNKKFCESQDGWGNTKVNFTAVLKCKDSAGRILRRCKAGGKWDEEESECVNNDLNKIREDTQIIDIGLGKLETNAAEVLSRLKAATNNSESINTYSNVDASVSIISHVTQKTKRIEDPTTLVRFLESSSNLLNENLQKSWTKKNINDSKVSLAEQYLSSVAQFVANSQTGITTKPTPNIELDVCNSTQVPHCRNMVFKANVSLESVGPGTVKTTGFKQLNRYLPHNDRGSEPNSIVVSTTTENKPNSTVIRIDFPLIFQRPRNHKLECVFWDEDSRSWSPHGCSWSGPFTEGQCVCNHLSSFTILMSNTPMDVPLIEEITYVGLTVSIISLILSIVIELSTWSSVVKTNISYLRHAAHVNISLSLLIADCCFLASSFPDKISQTWCQIMVVFKHFFYLSMFFWMLCLSTMLLYKAVFVFHSLSKKNYLRFSILLGYTCPLLIVFITFITNNSGAEGAYYSKDTCWLIYIGVLQGSIHTFLIPVGIIIVINVFCIFVVIMKLLDHHKSTVCHNESEKQAAKSVIRSVILLTPVFGVTWIFGFAVEALDLTYGLSAFAVNYIFTSLNAFQGLFILMAICLGDKLTRDALLKLFSKKPPASISESSTKPDSQWKK